MQLTTRTTIILAAIAAIIFYLLGLVTCNAYNKNHQPQKDTTITVPSKEVVNVYHDTGSIKVITRIVPRLDSFIRWDLVPYYELGSNKNKIDTVFNKYDSLQLAYNLLLQKYNTATSYSDTNYFPHARTITESHVYQNSLIRQRTSLIDTTTHNNYKLPSAPAFNLKLYYGGSLGWQQSTGLPYLGAVIGLKLPTNQIFLLNASINTKGQSLYTATYVVPFKK